MSRKRYTPEEIIGKRREAEVALSQGQTAAQVCRTLGIHMPIRMKKHPGFNDNLRLS
jgi:hypothetical protein